MLSLVAALQHLQSYVLGCGAAALAMGLMVAAKGLVTQTEAGLSASQGLPVMVFVSLMAFFPILFFALPAFLIISFLHLVRTAPTLLTSGVVWALNAAFVVAAMAHTGGHLVGPNSHGRLQSIVVCGIAGAVGGVVAWLSLAKAQVEISSRKEVQ
ncbi:MAG: hypothetical protein J0L76_04920 [Rhodobacterales bacterium]|nr:hypothetical protein [Rhodobacterales bacterium]